MDLKQEMRRIKEHFNHVSEEELMEKLNSLGLNDIQSLKQEGFEFITEKKLTQKDVQKTTYSRKNIYHGIDPNTFTYNVNYGHVSEVA